MGKQDGRFVWHDLITTEPSTAQAFYREVVGWTTESFGGSDYMMWVGSRGGVGGSGKLTDEQEKAGVSPHWVGHVQVLNVDETAARAERLGGKLVAPAYDMPGVGRAAFLHDPQGALISIYTPDQEGDKEPDTSQLGEFGWNELNTSDVVAAYAFYGELFGWRIIEDLDRGEQGIYRMFGIGDTVLGGIVAMPGFAPSWLYYANVTDVEAALERAKEHGGKVILEPIDVPGGSRIAHFRDPQGAVFALNQGPKK